jgi:hypothetical protein
VCKQVSPRVGGVAADVDAARKLAREGLGLDAPAMDELVLLEDVSATRDSIGKLM